MRPGESFACPTWHCTLSRASCAMRHVRRLAAGPGRTIPKFEACGKCAQGAKTLRQLMRRGWSPEPPQDGGKMATYRKARTRYFQSRVTWGEGRGHGA